MMRASLAARIAADSRLLNQVAQCRFGSIRSRAAYVRYLIQTYHYVVASVPLMELALKASYSATDPVFAGYLSSHIEEERGHDRWIVSDLGRLGVAEATLLQKSPLPEICQLAGSAYYSIVHRHPVSILGYMHALESAPATSEFLDGLARKSRTPKAAMLTLREHGERDTEHRAELAAVIDRYQGAPLVEAAIRDTALMTLSSLLAMLKIVTTSPASRRDGASA